MKKFILATGLSVSLILGALASAPAQAKAKHAPSNKKDGWVQFEPGSAKLSKTAKFELRLFVKKYKKAKSFKVTGYVQKQGTDANNKKLSKARAKSVRKYLRKLGVKVPIQVKGAKVPKKWGKSKSARRAVIKAVMPSSSSGGGNGDSDSQYHSCPNPDFDPSQYWITEDDNTATASDGDVQMTLKLSPKDQFTTSEKPVVDGCEVNLQWGYIMGNDIFPLSMIPGSYPFESEVTVGDTTGTSVLVDNMSQMSAYSMYFDLCNREHALGLQVMVGTEPYVVYPPDCAQPWIDAGIHGIQGNDVSFSYTDPWGRTDDVDLDVNRVAVLSKPGTGINVTLNTAGDYVVTVASTDGNLSEPPVGSPSYTLAGKSAGSHWTDTDSTTLPTLSDNRWYLIDYLAN